MEEYGGVKSQFREQVLRHEEVSPPPGNVIALVLGLPPELRGNQVNRPEVGFEEVFLAEVLEAYVFVVHDLPRLARTVASILATIRKLIKVRCTALNANRWI